MYQGHLSDGSSVQRHSAGPLYPAVIGVQERDFGATRSWFVIYPGKEEQDFPTSDEAVAYAVKCNEERKRAADLKQKLVAQAKALQQRQQQFGQWAGQRALQS